MRDQYRDPFRNLKISYHLYSRNYIMKCELAFQTHYIQTYVCETQSMTNALVRTSRKLKSSEALHLK